MKCTCKPKSFPFTCPTDGCARNQHFHKLCQAGVKKCLQHPDKHPRSDGASRGIGDTIAKITKATGVDRVVKGITRLLGKDDCGCPARQAAANEALPYALPIAPTLKLHNPDEESAPSTLNPQPSTTIGITAFRRPAALHRLVKSIRQRYAWPIVIADNGDDFADLSEFDNIKYLQLPFDCGLSAARNSFADVIDTEYMLLLEEDFEFLECTQIERFIDVLESDPAIGMVGGAVVRNGITLRLARDFDRFRGVLHCVPTSPNWQIANNGTPYHLTEYVYNFGLFRTEMLHEHRWDESLKLSEHADYFYDVRQRGQWRVAHCPSVAVQHHLERPTNYAPMRYRAEKQFKSAMLAKWGLVDVKHTKAEPESLMNDANIIVLGIGHSGTSVVTRMISQLGWDWGEPSEDRPVLANDPRTDEQFAEHAPIREYNDRLLGGQPFDRRRAAELLAELNWPWVIKDPRFVHTLHLWLPVLQKYSPPLIWLNRDLDDVKASYVRRTGQALSRDHSIEDVHRMARAHFEAWPWAKLLLRYEHIADAVAEWQPTLNSQPSTLNPQ